MDSTRPARGAWAAYPTRPFVGVELGGVLGYLIYAGLLVSALMFFVWSRVDVRTAAADLEWSQRTYQATLTEQDQLRLELATRSDLATLERSSAALGLVQDVELVEVPAK
ncbi:MAG: hypothetical protein ACI9VR_001915 [Cognaticolwellia sp.]|jgi:hypothetical protein